MADREAEILARRSKARKAASSSGNDKGKGVSSTTVGAASDVVTMLPTGKSTPLKGRKAHSAASYDVDRIARWKPPTDLDEDVRVELGKLPKLPVPRNCSRFGVLGIGPKYARHVVASYMSFAGDREKFSSHTSSDMYDSLLESATEMIAKLSFSAQAQAERDAALEKSAMESYTEMERLHGHVHSLETEIGSFNSEREQLVDAAVQQYVQGVEKGEVFGWDEALRTLLDQGHITQATIEGEICPYTLSLDDGDCDDLMEMDGVAGAGGEVTGEDVA